MFTVSVSNHVKSLDTFRVNVLIMNLKALAIAELGDDLGHYFALKNDFLHFMH